MGIIVGGDTQDFSMPSVDNDNAASPTIKLTMRCSGVTRGPVKEGSRAPAMLMEHQWGHPSFWPEGHNGQSCLVSGSLLGSTAVFPVDLGAGIFPVLF